MNKETKPRQGRRVGRPRVLEGGGASLAAVLNLVRTGTATTVWKSSGMPSSAAL